jgi:hypothetical protein
LSTDENNKNPKDGAVLCYQGLQFASAADDAETVVANNKTKKGLAYSMKNMVQKIAKKVLKREDSNKQNTVTKDNKVLLTPPPTAFPHSSTPATWSQSPPRKCYNENLRMASDDDDAITSPIRVTGSLFEGEKDEYEWIRQRQEVLRQQQVSTSKTVISTTTILETVVGDQPQQQKQKSNQQVKSHQPPGINHGPKSDGNYKVLSTIAHCETSRERNPTSVAAAHVPPTRKSSHSTGPVDLDITPPEDSFISSEQNNYSDAPHVSHDDDDLEPPVIDLDHSLELSIAGTEASEELAGMSFLEARDHHHHPNDSDDLDVTIATALDGSFAHQQHEVRLRPSKDHATKDLDVTIATALDGSFAHQLRPPKDHASNDLDVTIATALDGSFAHQQHEVRLRPKHQGSKDVVVRKEDGEATAAHEEKEEACAKTTQEEVAAAMAADTSMIAQGVELEVAPDLPPRPQNQQKQLTMSKERPRPNEAYTGPVDLDESIQSIQSQQQQRPLQVPKQKAKPNKAYTGPVDLDESIQSIQSQQQQRPLEVPEQKAKPNKAYTGPVDLDESIQSIQSQQQQRPLQVPKQKAEPNKAYTGPVDMDETIQSIQTQQQESMPKQQNMPGGAQTGPVDFDDTITNQQQQQEQPMPKQQQKLGGTYTGPVDLDETIQSVQTQQQPRRVFQSSPVDLDDTIATALLVDASMASEEDFGGPSYFQQERQQKEIDSAFNIQQQDNLYSEAMMEELDDNMAWVKTVDQKKHEVPTQMPSTPKTVVQNTAVEFTSKPSCPSTPRLAPSHKDSQSLLLLQETWKESTNEAGDGTAGVVIQHIVLPRKATSDTPFYLDDTPSASSSSSGDDATDAKEQASVAHRVTNTANKEAVKQEVETSGDDWFPIIPSVIKKSDVSDWTNARITSMQQHETSSITTLDMSDDTGVVVSSASTTTDQSMAAATSSSRTRPPSSPLSSSSGPVDLDKAMDELMAKNKEEEKKIEANTTRLLPPPLSGRRSRRGLLSPVEENEVYSGPVDLDDTIDTTNGSSSSNESAAANKTPTAMNSSKEVSATTAAKFTQAELEAPVWDFLDAADEFIWPDDKKQQGSLDGLCKNDNNGGASSIESLTHVAKDLDLMNVSSISESTTPFRKKPSDTASATSANLSGSSAASKPAKIKPSLVSASDSNASIAKHSDAFSVDSWVSKPSEALATGTDSASTPKTPSDAVSAHSSSPSMASSSSKLMKLKPHPKDVAYANQLALLSNSKIDDADTDDDANVDAASAFDWVDFAAAAETEKQEQQEGNEEASESPPGSPNTSDEVLSQPKQEVSSANTCASQEEPQSPTTPVKITVTSPSSPTEAIQNDSSSNKVTSEQKKIPIPPKSPADRKRLLVKDDNDNCHGDHDTIDAEYSDFLQSQEDVWSADDILQDIGSDEAVKSHESHEATYKQRLADLPAFRHFQKIRFKQKRTEEYDGDPSSLMMTSEDQDGDADDVFGVEDHSGSGGVIEPRSLDKTNDSPDSGKIVKEDFERVSCHDDDLYLTITDKGGDEDDASDANTALEIQSFRRICMEHAMEANAARSRNNSKMGGEMSSLGFDDEETMTSSAAEDLQTAQDNYANVLLELQKCFHPASPPKQQRLPDTTGWAAKKDEQPSNEDKNHSKVNESNTSTIQQQINEALAVAREAKEKQDLAKLAEQIKKLEATAAALMQSSAEVTNKDSAADDEKLESKAIHTERNDIRTSFGSSRCPFDESEVASSSVNETGTSYTSSSEVVSSITDEVSTNFQDLSSLPLLSSQPLAKPSSSKEQLVSPSKSHGDKLKSLFSEIASRPSPSYKAMTEPPNQASTLLDKDVSSSSEDSMMDEVRNQLTLEFQAASGDIAEGRPPMPRDNNKAQKGVTKRVFGAISRLRASPAKHKDSDDGTKFKIKPMDKQAEDLAAQLKIKSSVLDQIRRVQDLRGRSRSKRRDATNRKQSIKAASNRTYSTTSEMIAYDYRNAECEEGPSSPKNTPADSPNNQSSSVKQALVTPSKTNKVAVPLVNKTQEDVFVADFESQVFGAGDQGLFVADFSQFDAYEWNKSDGSVSYVEMKSSIEQSMLDHSSSKISDDTFCQTALLSLDFQAQENGGTPPPKLTEKFSDGQSADIYKEWKTVLAGSPSSLPEKPASSLEKPVYWTRQVTDTVDFTAEAEDAAKKHFLMEEVMSFLMDGVEPEMIAEVVKDSQDIKSLVDNQIVTKEIEGSILKANAPVETPEPEKSCTTVTPPSVQDEFVAKRIEDSPSVKTPKPKPEKSFATVTPQRASDADSEKGTEPSPAPTAPDKEKRCCSVSRSEPSSPSRSSSRSAFRSMSLSGGTSILASSDESDDSGSPDPHFDHLVEALLKGVERVPSPDHHKFSPSSAKSSKTSLDYSEDNTLRTINNSLVVETVGYNEEFSLMGEQQVKEQKDNKIKAEICNNEGKQPFMAPRETQKIPSKPSTSQTLDKSARTRIKESPKFRRAATKHNHSASEGSIPLDKRSFTAFRDLLRDNVNAWKVPTIFNVKEEAPELSDSGVADSALDPKKNVSISEVQSVECTLEHYSSPPGNAPTAKKSEDKKLDASGILPLSEHSNENRSFVSPAADTKSDKPVHMERSPAGVADFESVILSLGSDAILSADDTDEDLSVGNGPRSLNSTEMERFHGDAPHHVDSFVLMKSYNLVRAATPNRASRTREATRTAVVMDALADSDSSEEILPSNDNNHLGLAFYPHVADV